MGGECGLVAPVVVLFFRKVFVFVSVKCRPGLVPSEEAVSKGWARKLVRKEMFSVTETSEPNAPSLGVRPRMGVSDWFLCQLWGGKRSHGLEVWGGWVSS